MHEFALAQDILATIESEARKNNANRVLRVTLGVGRYAGIDKRSLAFGLEVVSSETVLQDASIVMEDIGDEGLCETCGLIQLSDNNTETCPECGKHVQSLENTELYLKELELDVEENHLCAQDQIEE